MGKPRPKPNRKHNPQLEAPAIESESDGVDAAAPDPVVRTLRSKKQVAIRALSREEVDQFEQQDEARKTSDSSSSDDEVHTMRSASKKNRNAAQPKRVQIQETIDLGSEDEDDDHLPIVARKNAKGVGSTAIAEGVTAGQGVASEAGRANHGKNAKSKKAPRSADTWVLMDSSFFDGNRAYNKALPNFNSLQVSDRGHFSDGVWDFG